ncbi:junctophilin-1-like [Dendronephthya gigantea]|uniref:junctophilin-1-like n=1 Tax=Dendronephthya gigantea TaxID=151771 RepID=UPI00106BA42F|nr:junctophilin-1-like [Dendronephthya gigantea]
MGIRSISNNSVKSKADKMENFNHNEEWSEDETFIVVDTYNGETKDGKRHGHGVYFYPNGDIYDGEWRKSQKYGYGIYIYSDEEKIEGFFYHDEYIGNEPNEKMRKRMTRKKKYTDNGDVQFSTKEKVKESLRVFSDHLPPRIKPDGAQERREASKQRNAWVRQKYFGES